MRGGLIADRKGGSGIHLHHGPLAIAALRQTGDVNVAIAGARRPVEVGQRDRSHSANSTRNCRSRGSSSLTYVNSILASPTQKVLPYIPSGYTTFRLLAVCGC